MNFLDTRIIKAVLALGVVAYNAYLFATGHWISGIFFLIITAIAVILVFRSIRMILAFLQLRQQKMEKAKAWLERINPDHLWKNQKGYYFFLLGSVDVQKNSLAQSEKYFRSALSHGLRMDHDKAAVYLNLAVLAANKRKKREAITHLNEAKRFDTKGYLKNDIKQVSKMVNSL